MSSPAPSTTTFRSVRVSKFRHVYGQTTRREHCYEGMRITASAHDSQFCAVNPKFIAVVLEVAGGGAFQVLPLRWMGKVDYHVGRISGHNGPVNDLKWNPFNDNVIATCSDDCTIKLWHIPDEGIKNSSTSWLCQLCGHSRKVAYIEWHPTAENVLASTGFDYKVLIWNVSSGDCLTEIECHEDVVYSLTFSLNGSLLATTCKDKLLRILDARGGQVLQEVVCHEGGKASKVIFLNDKKKLLTTGFSRTSHRQFALWDMDNLSHPLVVQEVDSSAGVLFPFYDDDLGIVYLAGKGDGNIRFYEILDSPPYIQYLSEFQSRFPQRGVGLMPKRGVNPSLCEIFRFYKVHTTQLLVEPISFIVPRKSESFQVDLYPPTAGTTPALSTDEWMCGIDKDPIRVSMRNAFMSTTNKPVQLKLSGQRPYLITSDRNNERKFQFLSAVTKADYREVTQREDYPDLLKQEQLMSKLHEKVTNQRHSGESTSASNVVDSTSSANEEESGGGGSGARARRHFSGGGIGEGAISTEEEIAHSEEEDLRCASPFEPVSVDAGGDRTTATTGSSGGDIGGAPLTPDSTSCPSSSLLPPRSPRTPASLSSAGGGGGGGGSAEASNVGHSPSKMRRISQSPAPSPFRELQMDDVMSTASDVPVGGGSSLMNGSGAAGVDDRRVSSPSSSRLAEAGSSNAFLGGSVEGALSLVSSDLSSNVVDAVSLPPSRTTAHSPAPIRAAEHSHLHANLPKFHKPQPVHMVVGTGLVAMSSAAEPSKRSTKPGVIGPGPIIPREQTAHIKPFRITQSQPPTPRENSMLSTSSVPGKKETEIQLLYTQQCRRVRELMDEAEVKDKRLTQLDVDVSALRQEMERIRVDSTRHNDEIESLRYEITWKDERIKYLEKELAKNASS